MKKTIIILAIGMLMTATFTATAVFEWNPDEPILWRDTPTMTLPDGPIFWREKPTFTVSEPVATFDPDDVVIYKWPYIKLPYPIIRRPWFIIPLPYTPPIVMLPDPIVTPYDPPVVKWPWTIVPIPYEPPIIRWPLPIVPIPYNPPIVRIPYPIIVPAPINLFQ